MKRFATVALSSLLLLTLAAPTLANAGSNSQKKQQKYWSKLQKQQAKDQKQQQKQWSKQHPNATTHSVT